MLANVSVKVLGSGCAKCQKLESLAREVIAESGAKATVEHVRDFGLIAAYGVMTTPGLVVNEAVKSVGRIPNKVEIKGWLEEAGAQKVEA